MIVKIYLSNKTSISLPYEKAKSILESPLQLVMIYDDKKKWTGKTINKAHIISTNIDEDASRNENLLGYKQPELKPQDEEKRVGSIKNTLKEKRQELKNKGIIK